MRLARLRPAADERGFTLIELMVVVLIIAILLTIAVPSFLAARHRAADRAAQSNVRNAHVTQMIVYADGERFTSDVGDLQAVDTSISYTQVLADMGPEGRIVYVQMLPDTLHVDDTVLVGAKSKSGDCFWIRTTGGSNQLRFADNDCSAIPASGSYKDEW